MVQTIRRIQRKARYKKMLSLVQKLKTDVHESRGHHLEEQQLGWAFEDLCKAEVHLVEAKKYIYKRR